MVFNPNGSQFSFLILDCLKDKTRYGLEIIDIIAKRTENKVVMKKPTLYSCLTRMEKKGLLSSSYWSDSELGGKRHYYTISDMGRKVLLDLKNTYNYSNIKENENVEESSTKVVFAQQDNLFNLLNNKTKDEKTSKDENKNEILDNQIDLFTIDENNDDGYILSSNEKINLDFNKSNEKLIEDNKQEIIEEQRDDAVLLSERIEAIEKKEKHFVEEVEIHEEEKIERKEDAILLSPEESINYNKKIYDTSSDLKKYRKRKSFSENQIEMNVIYENKEQNELHKKQIEEFKKSILENRTGNITIEQPSFDYFNRFEKKVEKEEKIVENNKVEEPPKEDDGLLITSPRLSSNEIPHQDKIKKEEIISNIGPLPAPKNFGYDSSYKDMIAKLYSRNEEEPKNKKQEKVEHENVAAYFADYESLKNYYRSHGVTFKPYSRQKMKYSHNTNKLKSIINVIMMGLIGIGSGLLYLILSLTGYTRISTDFFYYVPTIIMAVVVAFSFIRESKFESPKPCQRYNSQIMWLIFLSATIIIFSINICCGMFGKNLLDYSTTLFVPIFVVLAICPIRYYIADFVFKKYGK